MKQIQLTKGKFALVDDEDFEWLNQWKWCVQGQNSGSNFYAKRAVRKKIVHESENYFSMKMISMHRFIFGIKDINIVIDHIDGNGLNNQKSNLRPCTQTQNLYNRRSKGTKTSVYKGVSQRGISNQWRAYIHVKDKVLHLGTFGSEIDAAASYNIAALKYHGEFANLNKIKYDGIPVKIKTFKIPNTSSKYRGVCYVKKNNLWQASITKNNKLICLGLFDNETDAAHAYNDSVKKYFGENMPINKIEVPLIKGRNIKSSSSKFNGVSFYKTTNRWVARTIINNKRKCLGYFNTEIDAYNALQNNK